MKTIIEVEIGFPKCVVQYEGEPTSKFISTEKLEKELNLQLQQKRMYSEEEVKQFAFECVANFLSNNENELEQDLVAVIIDRNNKQFEQFKNK